MKRTLLFALLALAATPALSADLITLDPAQRQAVGIRTAPLGSTDDARIRRIPAQVVVPAGQVRVVAAPAAGLIESVEVVPGQKVAAGAPLARFASPQLIELSREAQVAQAQLDLAASNLKRDELLFTEGIIARARLESTRAQHRQAAALAEEKRLALAMAGVKPGQKGGVAAITAPIAGYVLEQLALPGQRVDAAAPLFKLGADSALWVELQVPTALAALLDEQARVAINGSNAGGQVVAVGRQVGSAQTVTVQARMDQGLDGLRPGQAVEAELKLPGGRDLTWVPEGALVRRGEGGAAYLFVETGGGFRPQRVTPVAQAGEGWLVRGDGVAVGTQVAVAGIAALKAAWLGIGAE